MKIKMNLLLILCSGLVSSCASAPVRDGHTQSLIEETMQQAVQQNQQLLPSPAPPGEVSNALVPPLQLDLPAQAQVNTEPHFDLKVDRAEARAFFMGLVDGTAYNMVVHPQVKGQISLDLKNVSVDEVMETVRSVYGYDYEKSRNAYHVFPDAMRTRIFRVNYLDIHRSGSSKLKVSSGQVTQTARGGSTSTSSGTGSSSSARDTVAASSIDTSNDSDFWKEVHQALVTLVGTDKGRNVVISPQSGVIVVRAMPDDLRAVARYLDTTQNIMQRQVLLEAKVVEVSLSDGYQTGINWAALKADSSGSQILLGQVGGGSIFSGGVSSLQGNTGTLDPSALAQVSSTATSAFGGMFTAALNIKQNFAAFLELLKTQGDVQVLSSPQVATMNNQKAVIKVGTDEFFVTNVESSTNTGTATSSTQNNVELTPFFSGVALDVIPQISEDSDITLHIHPTVVDVTEKVKNISVSSTQTLSVPLAVSSIRESDTMIRAKNGQVVIIGGLMKNSKANNNATVPLLGDLPLIGNLFRHDKQAMIKSELVILLKPTVVDDATTWAQGLRNSQAQFHDLFPNNIVTKTDTPTSP